MGSVSEGKGDAGHFVCVCVCCDASALVVVLACVRLVILSV